MGWGAAATRRRAYGAGHRDVSCVKAWKTLCDVTVLLCIFTGPMTASLLPSSSDSFLVSVNRVCHVLPRESEHVPRQIGCNMQHRCRTIAVTRRCGVGGRTNIECADSF